MRWDYWYLHTKTNIFICMQCTYKIIIIILYLFCAFIITFQVRVWFNVCLFIRRRQEVFRSFFCFMQYKEWKLMATSSAPLSNRNKKEFVFLLQCTCTPDCSISWRYSRTTNQRQKHSRAETNVIDGARFCIVIFFTETKTKTKNRSSDKKPWLITINAICFYSNFRFTHFYLNGI